MLASRPGVHVKSPQQEKDKGGKLSDPLGVKMMCARRASKGTSARGMPCSAAGLEYTSREG
eukprot:1155788-Pelagomonas_calceolata.AAC.1